MHAALLHARIRAHASIAALSSGVTSAAMFAYVHRAAAAYRRVSGRTGAAEPLVTGAVLTYGVLLLLCAVLNVGAPHWVSRNSHSAPVAGDGNAGLLASEVRLGSRVDDIGVGRCISRGLLEGVADDAVVDRVKAEFECGCRVPDVYEIHETPTVCAIVQSYNHAGNIERIAKALVDNPAIQEIIVCEDGSTDRSLDTWLEQLRELKHFIVVSNNLHETRCYNRAMRMSSAEYFVLMQDDDLPPAAPGDADAEEDAVSSNWVSEALELFDADPSIGVLTGFIGQMWDGIDKGYEFGEQQSDHGGTRKGDTRRIPFLSPRTVRPFMYVECAWIAPLFIRAKALRRMGGLDVGLFQQGEPGVWQDCVLSYAAWTAGWRVGVYDSMFKRGVGGHGSTSSPAKTKMREVVWKRAKLAVDERYDRAYVRQFALELNNRTLSARYGAGGAPQN